MEIRLSGERDSCSETNEISKLNYCFYHAIKNKQIKLKACFWSKQILMIIIKNAHNSNRVY